ncbi:MAG: GerMN domain-containing protein [Treponema sp.]|jgi:hypothetical protein|nr:GerMN domain-containing protein [Treponema sp.]
MKDSEKTETMRKNVKAPPRSRGLRIPSYIRRLLYLALLGIFTGIELLHTNKVRRTFLFYTMRAGTPVVEDRMLFRAPDETEEMALSRYVEEVLLGPVTPDAAPLFPRETRLRSLLYRDGVVYVDLGESAALPAREDQGNVLQRLDTLGQGIRRNFSFVQDVRFFIQGHEVPVMETTDGWG